MLSPTLVRRKRALSDALPPDANAKDFRYGSHNDSQTGSQDDEDGCSNVEDVYSDGETTFRGPIWRQDSVASSRQSPLPLLSQEERSARAKMHWRQLKSLVKMSSFTSRISYKPPPFAPLLSRQLHALLANNVGELNRAHHEMGQTQIGAVMFADCSGFTALTERLAMQAEMAQNNAIDGEEDDDASVASINGPEELCNIINAFFEKMIKTAHVKVLLFPSNFTCSVALWWRYR